MTSGVRSSFRTNTVAAAIAIVSLLILAACATTGGGASASYEYFRAGEILRRGVEESPDKQWILTELGRFMLRTGRPQRALERRSDDPGLVGKLPSEIRRTVRER